MRRLRAGKRDVVPVCLIGAPLLGLALQSYGGEGPYRAYLFALPWLAFLAAHACMRSRSPLAGARLSVALIAVTPGDRRVSAVFAYFGQELANRIPAQDVQAESWYFAADRPEVLSGPDAIAPMRELEPRAERDSQSGARAIGAFCIQSQPPERAW